MFDSSDSDHSADAWVRQNAGSAGIAALLMLYFGFVALAAPTGTGLFERSNWLLFHTVRIGGIAMAIIAVASLLGHPLVLALDAAASTVIGVALILSGGGMLIGGGGTFQDALLIIFGMMFIGAGLRNGRLYTHLTKREQRLSTSGSPESLQPKPRPPSDDASQPSLAARLAERSRQKTDPLAEPHAEPEPPTDPRPETEPAESRSDKSPTDEPKEPEPEGGFLASFARKDDSHRQ